MSRSGGRGRGWIDIIERNRELESDTLLEGVTVLLPSLPMHVSPHMPEIDHRLPSKQDWAVVVHYSRASAEIGRTRQ